MEGFFVEPPIVGYCIFI